MTDEFGFYNENGDYIVIQPCTWPYGGSLVDEDDPKYLAGCAVFCETIGCEDEFWMDGLEPEPNEHWEDHFDRTWDAAYVAALENGWKESEWSNDGNVFRMALYCPTHAEWIIG